MKLHWTHFFIPHERNNHRAYIIQPGFIGIFIALYLLNLSFIRSLTLTRPGILGYSSEITSQKVFDLTNSRRQKAGLPPLRYNPVLQQSAAAKAHDMFSHNYWAHNSPKGRTPWDFFRDNGYQYTVAGENLAKDFYDTDSMMRAWMNSPTHKANIVSSKYEEIGVGVVNGVLNGVKTTLVVQHFGTPTSSQASPPRQTESNQDSVRVLAQEDVVVSGDKFTISPLQINKLFATFMFFVIIAVLVIDGYHTLKNKTHRLSGSNAAHIGFLLIIFMLLLFTRQGSILY